MIKIIKKTTLDKLYEEIDELNKEIDVTTSKKNQALKDKEKIINIKNTEIKRLEDKIRKDKEAHIIEVTKKNGLIENLNKEIETIKIKLSSLTSSKGGYTKEINKLKEEIKELTNKNQNQAIKIQELLKGKIHTTEEYKNNGLRKNMKKRRG